MHVKTVSQAIYFWWWRYHVVEEEVGESFWLKHFINFGETVGCKQIMSAAKKWQKSNEQGRKGNQNSKHLLHENPVCAHLSHLILINGS